MKKTTKKTEKENLKTFYVNLEFYREKNSYGVIESRKISFFYDSDSSKYVDIDILNELEQELIKNKSVHKEDVSKIGLDLEEILKIIQKSKTIKSFKKKITEYVIRSNWGRLIGFFMERDGEPTLKLEDVLNSSWGSWEDYYGCNVDIDVDEEYPAVELEVEEKLKKEREERAKENMKHLYEKLNSLYKKLQEKQNELKNRLGDKDLDLNNLVEECVNLGKEYASLKMTYIFLSKDINRFFYF
jgi:hypothetical protein